MIVIFNICWCTELILGVGLQCFLTIGKVFKASVLLNTPILENIPSRSYTALGVDTHK